MGLEEAATPPNYEALFKEVSENGKTVTGKAARVVLSKSKLKTETLQNIWKLCDRHKKGFLNEKGFYTALALTTLAVKGKRINQYLLADLKSYPALGYDATLIPDYVPDGITDASYSYETLARMEDVKIGPPTQHGSLMKFYLFPITFKQSEYVVERRYSDFEILRSVLCARYPFRIILEIPPKKLAALSEQFLNERRLGLEQFLNYLGRHPILSQDEAFKTFKDEPVDKVGAILKSKFSDSPEEFTMFPERVERSNEKLAEIANNEKIEAKLSKVLTVIKGLLKLTRENISIKKGESKNQKMYAETYSLLSIDLPGTPLPCKDPKDLEDMLIELSRELTTLSEFYEKGAKRVFDECHTQLQGFIGVAEAYQQCFVRRLTLLQQKQEQFKRSHQVYKAALKGREVTLLDARKSEQLLESRRQFADYCIYRESLWFQAHCNELITVIRLLTQNTVESLNEQLTLFQNISKVMDRLEYVKF